MPFTKFVKILVISNVAIWFVFQIIIEQFVLTNDSFTRTFSLIPILVLQKFHFWQPLTYMFLHASNPVHICFNMLMLWWLGSELEQKWGSRFFITYYLVCGLGAAVIYIFGAFIHGTITGSLSGTSTPVVGASGALFGLMVAYAIFFGERVMLFMMMIPMKAKYFVLILGMMEVILVLNNGVGGSSVANLAHLGGLVTGFLFLWGKARLQSSSKRSAAKDGRGLRLVVNNKKDKDSKGEPRFWN